MADANPGGEPPIADVIPPDHIINPAPHPDNIKPEIPQNGLMQFWNNPANANMIAAGGWMVILAAAYVYFYGKPAFLERKSTYSDNYFQTETEKNKVSREEHIRRLAEKLNEGAAERRAEKLAQEEEKRRQKLEIAEGKMKAREQGQHFSGGSNTLGEDDDRDKKLEELKALKKSSTAKKSTKSLRDDDFNPLGGNSSGARYRNTSNCPPRGG